MSFISYRPTGALNTCFLILLAAFVSNGYGQQASGTIYDESGQALVGATVLALPQATGTVADIDGAWQLDTSGVDSLQFSYVGYRSKTYATGQLPPDGKIILGLQELNLVVVEASRRGNYSSTLAARNVESVTSTELKKAPCCNLGESFETNATVDVSYRDPATGSREMQVLGLRGVYSQLLLEKRPVLYGLASPIALDLIPGTWLESIQISKGAGSVQTGANALSGQVNTELIKPYETDPLFVNLFASGLGRFEGNVHAAREWNQLQSTGLMLHASSDRKAFDHNNDSWYDQSGRRTYTGMLRHFYRSDNLRAQINVWGVSDHREGGQNAESLPLGTIPYRITQHNERLEAFGKVGYLGFERPATSLGLIAGMSTHALDNSYGATQHDAAQHSAYANLLYASFIGTTDHTYTLGASYRVDQYREEYAGQNLDRNERVAGLYGEYTYNYLRLPGQTGGIYGWSVIAGLRADHHNLGGLQVLPRLTAKLNPSENWVLRASAGRAYRSPQVLAENVRLLPSSRRVEFIGEMGLARGWNYGLATTYNFEHGHSTEHRHEAGMFMPNGQFTLDLYATEFEQLALIDQESDPYATRIRMSGAPARTLAALASLRYEPVRGLELKLAYKHVFARQTYPEYGELAVPYVPRYRGLATVSYRTPAERWRFNTNIQLVGPQRLPLLEGRIEPAQGQTLTDYSNPYALINAQVTRIIRPGVELYAGAENIGNFRQPSVLLSEFPDEQYFDASRVYAPLTGIMPYLGFRYAFGRPQ